MTPVQLLYYPNIGVSLHRSILDWRSSFAYPIPESSYSNTVTCNFYPMPIYSRFDGVATRYFVPSFDNRATRGGPPLTLTAYWTKISVELAFDEAIPIYPNPFCYDLGYR